MRCLLAILLLFAPALAAPASAAQLDIKTREDALRWIGGYRDRPQPDRVPELVRDLSAIGAFNDPESTGSFVGFIAGALGRSPDRAERMVEGMLPVRKQDHWVIIRAVAYSGLPDWKNILLRHADAMATRRVMIDKYVAGELPTLIEVGPAPERSFGEKVRDWFSREDKGPQLTWKIEASPELLDTLWGYYFATGSYAPIYRMITMLPWSKDNDHVDKLTVGSMTKYTLAINATRDATLRAMLRRAAKNQPKDVKPILDDLIDAAETADTVRIRKEQLAAIEEIKRKGPGYKRELTGLGRLAEGGIGIGCVTAAVMSVGALGIPCVVGGAATSAALRYFGSQ